MFCWLALTLANEEQQEKKNQMTVSFLEEAGLLKCFDLQPISVQIVPSAT